MRRIIFTLATLIALAGVAAAACGGGSDSSVSGSDGLRALALTTQADFSFADSFDGDFEEGFVIEQAALETAQDAPSALARGSAAGASTAPSPDSGTDPAVQIDERRVIQNASLTLRVDDVRPATESVRQIAETLGGFVEQLSLSGSTDEADGFVVIRVPQGEFFTAIERVSALGEVLGENVSSQDVTAQFVDLEAQLRSLTREEGRLLELLERANTVSEILVVEGELIRIRTQIERLQGSLNFLERRVALATITVSLIPPQGFVTEPPTAVLSIEVGRVERAQDEVKDLAERLDGVVERSTLRVIDDEAVATVRIRVPRDVFLQAVDSIEDLGDVRQKTLEEGGQSRFLDLPADFVIEEPDEPDALIDVRLASDGGSDTALIASLAGSLGGLALLLVIGLTIWRLRRRPAPQA